MDNEELMVTIRCLAYNHEPYIRQCLEGFVMQKTNFRFEAIVHDDASTDGTAAIIKEYAEKYPDIIKPIFETENQYSKRDGSIKRIMNAHTHGKYIAYCEGDDYWTDPLKLQTQIDFLENNLDYSFACHRYNIYGQNTGQYLKEYAYEFYKDGEDLEITLDLFSKIWVTQILTTVMRTDIYKKIYPMLTQYRYSRDVHLYYHLLKEGKGVSLNRNMGVYRWHDGGVASTLSGITRYELAYNIYKELLEKNENDKILRKIFLKKTIRYLRYIPISITTWGILRNSINLTNSIRVKCSLVLSFIFPTVIYTKLVKRYRKMYLKRIVKK